MNIWIIFSLVLLSSVLGAFGQIAFKMSTKKLISLALIVGLFLYGIGTVLFIALLKFNELTILYPLTSMSHIWVLLLANKYFGERINRYKVIGIVLIIIGIVFIV